MTRQLLIFDLDGTLIDSRQDLATAVNLMRTHYGLPPLSVDTVSGFVGNGMRRLVERSLDGADVSIDEAVELQRRFYLDHLHDATALYPGVAEGLTALHDAGHVLALATNKDAAACEAILKHFRLRSLFSNVLGGGSTGNLKPHPEMIIVTMRRLAMTPEDAWMVGDHVTDIQCARFAGVKSIFLSYGIGSVEGESPTLTFSSFRDFADAFMKEGPEPHGNA